MAISDAACDEIEALEAIYPDLITKLNDDRIKMKIPQHEGICLHISFPEKYPEIEPPHLVETSVGLSISSLYNQKYLQSLFEEVLDSIFKPGEVCIFDFLTELDGVLHIEAADDSQIDEKELENRMKTLTVDPLENWIMSEPITDRKSTFVAFATKAENEEEAFNKLAALKTDNKIIKAHHVMTAWRIKGKGDVVFQDCDDDGENAAGGRMLHLLVIMGAWNVIVAVARWYGGIHLGPDRFKHINSVTREIIVKGKYADNNATNITSRKGK